MRMWKLNDDGTVTDASGEWGGGALPAGIIEPPPEFAGVADLRFLKHTGGVVMARTAEEIAAILAADEQARQLAKSLALRTAENEFLSLCDLITGTTSHTKLSFTQIKVIIEAMPVEQQPLVSIKLLAIDAELKREGGNLWWDDCIWHPELI